VSRDQRTRARGGHASSFRCRTCRLDVPMHAPGTRHRNHCPTCLHSLHLDEAPGDRAAGCAGVMAPLGIGVGDDGEWAIVHRCTACATVSLNRIAGDDNPWSLVRLARRPLERPPFPLAWVDDA
jgi:hypothetical protein